MLSFERDAQQNIPQTAVKIIGIGGGGCNMLDRFALDGMEDAELLAMHSDTRVLHASAAGEKIQLGAELTHGLGCGGDPTLGEQTAHEQEKAIQDAIRNYRMIFLCVGLGGGTGSGAAPIVARIAREMDAFVVVFATMPFSFEGPRRREQAENALNQLSVMANALVTFDNGRMGELVLAESGVHEAFAAADRMIAESIKAVTRLVIRPGLIKIGLDDLVSALRTRKSRCLFGSGVATGANRAQSALKNALQSPLLDKGQLLNGTETVLVHICGGESLTLYEIELLMRELAKSVPDSAQILFGAAIDPAMADEVSLTLISALPEELLLQNSDASPKPQALPEPKAAPEPEKASPIASEPDVTLEEGDPEAVAELKSEDLVASENTPEELSAELPDEEPETQGGPEQAEDEPGTSQAEAEEPELISPEAKDVVDDSPIEEEAISSTAVPQAGDEPEAEPELRPRQTSEVSTHQDDQSELALDGGPRGRFDGEDPNLFDGEDLDVPPFLRGK